MNAPLHKEQIDRILPLLPPMATHMGNGVTLDRHWLETFVSQSVGSIDALTFQELELWADILQQVRTKGRSEASAIESLQSRGIAEAPAVLAVYAASGPAPIMGAKSNTAFDILTAEAQQKQGSPDALTEEVKTAILQKDYHKAAQIQEQIIRLRNRLKPPSGGVMLLAPTELYHEWLPDHEWHCDLDWADLPSFIRSSPRLTEMLRRGEEVNTKHLSYRIKDGRLARKLHDDLPAMGLENARERYHEWLPDHEWHNDLDWAHLPVWLKRDRKALNDLFIHRKQVNGKYVSYRVVDNRLLRKLHDSFPVIALEAPREGYHKWLPNHEWHDDLDWAHLPVWIKQSQESFNGLLVRGRQVDGKYVSYKVVGNRLMRKLHDSVPVIALKAPHEKYHEWLPDREWHDDLDWAHLPSWIKDSQKALADLFIHGRQVDGKNVSYKVMGKRLLRRLRDGVPVARPSRRRR